ncbi:MAG: TonB-dependent receptor [Campylobacterales bacterium]|nr:TonB-dependent receptor [Campylobacterales bacterium]
MKKTLALSLSLALSTALLAKEKESLGKLTITSNKQGETKITEIAGSVSVIDSLKLTDQNIDSTTKLQNLTPSFYITKTGPSMMTTFASMRGITGGMIGIPAVGLYVDDVYYSGLDFPLFDIERVEILKGPQGTLFGRNSEAGVVNIITKKPNKQDSGKISLDYGSFNTMKIDGSINKVINEDTVFRTAIKYNKTDGYFKNKNNDSNGAEETNQDIRAILDTKLSDRLFLTTSIESLNNDASKYAQFAAYDEKDLRNKINVDKDGKASQTSNGANFKAKYHGDSTTIVSITSFRDESYKVENDLDFSTADNMYLNLSKDLNYISEELRFISDNTSDLNWIGGLFFLSETDKRDYKTDLKAYNMKINQVSETKTTTTALFGEVSKKLSNTKLTFGIRHEQEKKDFDYKQTGMGTSTGSKDKTFDATLPKISLSYQNSDKFIPYITMAKGYRSGGFNDKDNIGSPYKPEFTTNYEVGFKSYLNDMKITGAFYNIKWSDMQVEVPVSGGSGVFIENASEATSTGGELELDYFLSDSLTLSAGLSSVESKYDSYTSGTTKYDGKYVTDVPKTTTNFSLNYRGDSGIYTGANYSSFQDIYFDSANTKSQSYAITNVKIGYEQKDYDIYIYGNNIFDKEYKTRAFQVQNNWYARAGAPQHFGANVKYRF